MVLNETIFAINVVSVIFLLATLIFLVKNREFERLEVENSLNALIFGIFFILLVMLIRTFVSLDAAYKSVTASLGDVSKYINYLNIISDVALIPLFAVCFFVGIFLARDYLSDFPKILKKEDEK